MTLKDLNDFFDLHAEELKNELRGSSESEKPAPPEKGEYGLRVHELYQDFLKVVQCNLEGATTRISVAEISTNFAQTLVPSSMEAFLNRVVVHEFVIAAC